jgi:hypothetical protein
MPNYSVGYSDKKRVFVVYGPRARKLGSFRLEREAWDFVRRQSLLDSAKKAEAKA